MCPLARAPAFVRISLIGIVTTLPATACSLDTGTGPEEPDHVLLELTGTVTSAADGTAVPHAQVLVRAHRGAFGVWGFVVVRADAEGRWDVSEEMKRHFCPFRVSASSEAHLPAAIDIGCPTGTQTVDIQILPYSSLRIDIAPDSIRIGLGVGVDLEAPVFAPGRREPTGLRPQWKSRSPEVAEIDRTGRVQGVAPGVAIIEASLTGIADTAVVVVAEAPPDPTGPVAFVYYREDVTLVDLDAALGMGPPIRLPEPGRHIHAHPDGSRIYVSGKTGLMVLDGASGQVRRTIGIPSGATDFALTPDGTRALVVTGDSSSVIATVELATGAVEAEAELPGRALDIVIGPAGTRAYIAHLEGVRALDLTTGARSGDDIVFPIAAQRLAVSPDGSTIHVALTLGRAVAVIDATTWTVRGYINVGGRPSDLAFSTDGSRVFVADGSRTRPRPRVAVIDAISDTELPSITLSGVSSRLAISPDGATLVASIPSEDALAIIDTATGTQVGDLVPIGYLPWGLTIRP